MGFCVQASDMEAQNSGESHKVPCHSGGNCNGPGGLTFSLEICFLVYKMHNIKIISLGFHSFKK